MEYGKASMLKKKVDLSLQKNNNAKMEYTFFNNEGKQCNLRKCWRFQKKDKSHATKKISLRNF